MTLLLKASEFHGAKDTAVAGRVVILSEQMVPPKTRTAAAAAPSKGKKKGEVSAASLKVEMHLASTDAVNEVVYVEAWAEQATQLLKKCSVGDLISIAGATVITSPQSYSTSRLHYHLRLKGTIGIQVVIETKEKLPWDNVPQIHPLVPLESLERVKDRNQICVAVKIVENPGTVERDTQNGRQLVCNAIAQAKATRLRCAFWREHAETLAQKGEGSYLLLYQVYVSKKKGEDSWELSSWRGTQIVDAPDFVVKILFFGTNDMFFCLLRFQ